MEYSAVYDEKTNTTVYRVPLTVNEAILQNAEDDGYSVYINESLTDEEAREAFNHALGHVQRNDFEKADVQKIEAEAHQTHEEPLRRPVKERRTFTPLDIALLRRDPSLAALLGIEKIPRRPNAPGCNLKKIWKDLNAEKSVSYCETKKKAFPYREVMCPINRTDCFG